MMNETTTARLEMRWMPVLDAAGRTRMEASWVLIDPVAATHESAVTHAA